MFPRPNNESDFMLFPEQQAHTPFATPPMEMQYNQDGYAFPQVSGYETNMMYSEAPFSYNNRASPVDGELHVPSSRFSNSSAPSASSSPEGSPMPNAGQLSFIPDYHNALGVNPSIVGQPDYYTGTEYSFTAPGLDEFNMAYESKPGFVGESKQLLDVHTIPRTPSGFKPSNLALDTEAAQSASLLFTAESSRTRLAPGPSASSGLFPYSFNRVPRSDSIPAAGDTSYPTPTPQSPRVSFFSQSSGHFVAPLGSSCWSPLASLNTPVLRRG